MEGRVSAVSSERVARGLVVNISSWAFLRSASQSHLRAEPQAPCSTTAPVAAQFWSYLPHEGKVVLEAHIGPTERGVQLPITRAAKFFRLRSL